MQHNGTLTTLDLYNNNIGPKGAEFLANALPVCLRPLCLFRMRLCHAPCVTISVFPVVQSNSTLLELRLYGNMIGDDGCEHLGRALVVLLHSSFFVRIDSRFARTLVE